MKRYTVVCLIILFVCGTVNSYANVIENTADIDYRYKGDYLGEYAGKYQFDINQQKALFSTAINVVFKGLQSGQIVTIKADTVDGSGSSWVSEATFKADLRGIVDLTSQSPIIGTYQKASAMGLFWSMHTNDDAKYFTINKSYVVRFTAYAANKVLTQSEVLRLSPLDMERVVKEEIRTDKFVANFYRPRKKGTYPSIIHLTGSGGGMGNLYPALLAAEGFAVLSVAYFGVETLPEKLVGIPIEYFDHAIDWLKNNKGTHNTPMAIMGGSRGSEAAVLIAARRQEFDAIVLTVPSAVTWLAPGIEGMIHSAWSIKGKETPYLGVSNFEGLKWLWQVTTGDKNIVTLPMFDKALKESSKKEIEAVLLPIENTKAPILFISGEEDMIWPSTLMANMLMKKLDDVSYPYAYQHLSLPNAGHNIGIPNLPTGSQVNPTFLSGGSLFWNESASLQVHQKTIHFLKEHLHFK